MANTQIKYKNVSEINHSIFYKLPSYFDKNPPEIFFDASGRGAIAEGNGEGRTLPRTIGRGACSSGNEGGLRGRSEIGLRILKEEKDRQFLRLHPPPEPDKFEVFKNRICENKEPVFLCRVCKNCCSTELNAVGEVKRYLATCGIPFCRSEECIKKRTFQNRKELNCYFYAHKQWKGRGARWLHLTLGFPRQKEKPTRKYLQVCRCKVRQFLNRWKKECNDFRLKLIAVQDISFNSEKGFYVHYHLAARPMLKEYLDTSLLNQIGQRYGLKPNVHGYRKSFWLIRYFAQRQAGLFEHECNGTSWHYADHFTAEEYFNTFHKRRKLLVFGFSSKEKLFIKNQVKVIRTQQGALSSIIADNQPYKCADCGCTRFIMLPIKLKPPPDTEMGFKAQRTLVADEILSRGIAHS